MTSILLLTCLNLFGAPDSLPKTDTLAARADTSAPHLVDSTAAHRDSVGKAAAPWRPNPGTAALLSLLPGGGQYYTRNPLKGVLFGVAELGLAGASVYEYRRGDTGNGNIFLYFTGFAFAVSMADAYVSAGLYGYREEERLNLHLGPAGLGVAYRF